MKKGKELATTPKGMPNSVQLGAMLGEETKRQKVLDKFIQKNLKLNVDYGVIPGTQKPTLYKAGAEKVIGLFNIRAEFARDLDTIEMLVLPGVVAFKCSLINRQTGEVVGEGRGVATPKEKLTWTPNTQVKICEKRAMVDAVLQTFGLSSRYTQDVEDLPRGKAPRHVQPKQVHQEEPERPMQSIITEKQLKFIKELIQDIPGVSQAKIETQFGKKLEQFGSLEARGTIDQLLDWKKRNDAKHKEVMKEVMKDYKAREKNRTVRVEQTFHPVKTEKIHEGEVVVPAADGEVKIEDLPK